MVTIRPRWRRLSRIPRLYREYRAAGMPRRDALTLMWFVLTFKVPS